MDHVTNARMTADPRGATRPTVANRVDRLLEIGRRAEEQLLLAAEGLDGPQPSPIPPNGVRDQRGDSLSDRLAQLEVLLNEVARKAEYLRGELTGRD